MNKFIRYTLLFIGLSLISCTDDWGLFHDDGQKVPVSLTVSFSGDIESRDVTDKNEELDYTTDPQCAMSSDDVYVLIFNVDENDKANELLGLVQDLKLEHLLDYTEKRLVGTIPAEVVGKNIRLAVLANLDQNGIDIGSSANMKEFLESQIGKTAQTIYPTLQYKYTHTAPWKIVDNGEIVRRIPMWGETEKFKLPVEGETLDCFLYRAIAKVNIWMNEKKGIPSFRLNSITVNHANNGGYCVSSKEVKNDIKIQYTEPDVPASVTAFTDDQKIVYSDFTEDQATKAFSDVIFLPEHVNTAENGTPVSLTVNYNYDGKTGLTKDIEFKDKEGKPFDIIRNHSYIFNIKKTNVDIAFTWSVAPWEVDYMRGVPDQYTLTVSKSVITLKDYMDYGSSSEHIYTFDVWTDYAYGWEIDTDNNGYIISTDGKTSIDWLNIKNETGVANTIATVEVNANKINTGLAKTASFYVKAGNIRKEITVIMPQPETANCYVVGDGQYEIIVSIKGNGVDGTRPDGPEGPVDIVDNDENTTPEEDAVLEPHTLGIIWETKAGLISLYNYEDQEWYTGKDRVPYNKETSTLKYFVKSNNVGASIAGADGGNALVGAFDENGKVIWSWHIWVCPEMYDVNTHQIKENAFLQHWDYTGYDVMDRNLGALSNKPIESQEGNKRGVAAMGLQYQWGRKDPFIGPAYSNDDFNDNDNTGLLPVVHYYEEWGVNGNGNDIINSNLSSSFDENSAIGFTIEHPTQLVWWTHTDKNPTALVSTEDIGGFLWGTDEGLKTDVKELGTKTIYDPCPVGYRVPPVDAFMFSFEGYKGAVNGPYLDGNTWKYNNYVSRKNYADTKEGASQAVGYNFRDNTIYIPHYVTARDQNYYVLGNDNKTQIYRTTKPNGWYQWGDYTTTPSCYGGAYVVDADYYGFYVNIHEIKEPVLVNEQKSSTATGNKFDDAREYGNTSNKVSYYYKPKEGQTLTWLPMTGAYDPTQGVSFKDDNGKTINIEQGSTITVNSFLWTNSSIERANDRVPGALSLHGTEVHTSSDGDNVNGRHFHNMSNTYANVDRHYTSAVRCIKDVKKVSWENINSLSKTATVTAGGSTTITIKSVNSSWKLIDPGAPWLLVTPDKGNADKGKGTSITLKAASTYEGNTTKGLSTIIKIQIEGETTARQCTVTVK